MPVKTARSTTKKRSSPARSAKKAAPRKKALAPTPWDDAEPRNVTLGDVLQIERRYIVEGVLTCVTDKGKFAGVQNFGSAEHLVIEDKKTGEARMIPLHTISEITLLEPAKRPVRNDAEQAFDPSVA